MALTKHQPTQKAPAPPLYTRYCAAPEPAHPVWEPSFLHALLVAAWLGRLIDPLPMIHPRHKAQGAERQPGEQRAPMP